MKNNLLIGTTLFAGLIILALACVKDAKEIQRPAPFPTTPPASFVEEFDSVGALTRKGWVFRNNSNPIGQSGWRQGRYEAATSVQYKFLAPVPFVGFPAYSANATPNDFISCDVSAGNDESGSSNISAWLISPQLPMRNNDQIIFYTRASDDANYSVYTKDRMQVRANFIDGTANVGRSAQDTGSFTTVLLDINRSYVYNDPGGNTPAIQGYPRQWTKYTITLNNLPNNGSVTNGRFAFRYIATDAGLFGGTSGSNYPTVVGIDSLAFIHK